LNDHESPSPLDSLGTGHRTQLDADSAHPREVEPSADHPPDGSPASARSMRPRLALPGRWETRVGLASLLSFLVLVAVLVINRRKGDVRSTHPVGTVAKGKADGRSQAQVAAADKGETSPSKIPPRMTLPTGDGTASPEEATSPPPAPVASGEPSPSDPTKSEAGSPVVADVGLPSLPPDDEKDLGATALAQSAASPADAPPMPAILSSEPGMAPPDPLAPPAPAPAPANPPAGSLPVAAGAPPVPEPPPAAEAVPLPSAPAPETLTGMPTPDQAGHPAATAPAQVEPPPSQQTSAIPPAAETPVATPVAAAPEVKADPQGESHAPKLSSAPELKADPQGESHAPKLSSDVPAFAAPPTPTEPVTLPARASAAPKGPWVPLPNTKNRLIGAAGGGIIVAGAAASLGDSSDDPKKDRVQPIRHLVRGGDSFDSISENYYGSGRFSKALWSANRSKVPRPGELTEGQTILIPPPEQLDRSLIVPSSQSTTRAGHSARPVTRTKRVASASEVSDDVIGLPIAPPKSRSAAILQGDRDPIDPQYQPEYPRYRVRAYDTLRSIARKKLGDSHRDAEIIDLNPEILGEEARVVAGQVLKLPLDARDQ
jgi:nucleoid-associated protein YgaU